MVEYYEVVLRPPVVPLVQNAPRERLVPNSFRRPDRNRDRSDRLGDFGLEYRGAGYGTIPFAESATAHSACTCGTSALASADHLFGFEPFRRLQSRSGIPSTALTLTRDQPAKKPTWRKRKRARRREYIMGRIAEDFIS